MASKASCKQKNKKQVKSAQLAPELAPILKPFVPIPNNPPKEWSIVQVQADSSESSEMGFVMSLCKDLARMKDKSKDKSADKSAEEHFFRKFFENNPFFENKSNFTFEGADTPELFWDSDRDDYLTVVYDVPSKYYMEFCIIYGSNEAVLWIQPYVEWKKGHMILDGNHVLLSRIIRFYQPA